MKNQKSHKTVLLCAVVALVIISGQVLAQPSSSRGPGRGLFGDWDLKIQFGEREMNSILSFSRNAEGELTAQLINFWGLSELQDVKFEEGKLSFVQVVRFGDNEFTSTFAGTIEEGALTGMLSSDRGESKVEGKRSQRMPRVVGNWNVKYTVGERERTSTLVIKADKEGALTADWQSERVQNEITDLNYERGQLTFTRKSKMGDREWESTFEGRIERGTDNLSGMLKSDQGEIEVKGERIGAPLIGTWKLEITSERGTRAQRLRVNGDLSALYGTIRIKKVNLEDDKVSFKTVQQFGEQTFETSFEGKLAESKLTGELTTSRGTRKVVGQKVVRSFRRRSTG
ncbi:MAG: hypothetical protein JSU70_13805 [Phycisphaerales bacterium]|nr:MAG: hypothetical protein JSU70_13805 [Phycisphaerales bacterium]